MKKQDLQPDNLERISRKVFNATRPIPGEIEKIVTSPQLFASIKARLAIDEHPIRQENPAFTKRSYFPFWTYPAAAGGFIILFVCLSLTYFTKEDLQPVAGQKPTPEIRTSELPPELSFYAEEQRTNIPAVKKQKNPSPVAFKAKSSKQGHQIRNPNSLKRPTPAQNNSSQVFYSLMTGGNLENNGEDLRVIRAELSKSELFALGINLPLENETIKIKTYLLIGEDGMARAIRFVEKH